MFTLRPFALVALLIAASGCGSASESLAPVRRCSQELVYSPLAGESVNGTVELRGEWNGFAASGETLTARADGSFARELTLPPRDYAYRFVVNGKETLDASNPYRRWVGNSEYSLLQVPDCGQPLLEVSSFEVSRAGDLRSELVYVDGRHHAGADASAFEVLLDGAPVEYRFDEKTGRLSLQRTELAKGKHHLHVRARDRVGRAVEPLYLPFWVEDEPFVWDGATMYFVLLDRFRNGKRANDEAITGVDPLANFQGGDFEGVRQAIEEGYFDALGVNVLWLSPVDENTDLAQPGTDGRMYSAYHGYWPSQPRSLQRRFGTQEELAALTRAAHARGIRVLADVVLNHVHRDHPYFVAERSNGWFNVGNSCVCGAPGCDWEARRLDCWFTPYLPDVNWRNPAVGERMVNDALALIQQADLDGFRVDAVKHMDHIAVRTLAGRLEEITRKTGTPFFLMGETFAGTGGRALLAEFIGPHELQGQFDFPLYWPVVDAFARGRSLTLVDAAVTENEAFYALGTVNGPFLGNHDVPRFLSIAAGAVEEASTAQAWTARRPADVHTEEAAYVAAKLAFTFLLTQPGVPLIYYGDEVGLPGAGDPDNRRMMRFGLDLAPQQADLLAWVKKVGTLRRQVPALRSRTRRTLRVEDDLYVYRTDVSFASAVVAINRSAEERTLTVDLEPGLGEGGLRDRLGQNRASVVGGQLTLTLAPRSAGVFTLDEGPQTR